MQRRLNRVQLGLVLSASLLLIIFDQISKFWIRDNFVVGDSWPESGILRITHVTNTGASFGLFANQSTILAVLSIAIVIGIILIIRHLTCITNLSMLSAGLVIGGAVGNLIDRFRLGYITDFIDVRLWGNFHWPVFNFADSAIVIGTAIFTISLFLSSIREKQHEEYS